MRDSGRACYKCIHQPVPIRATPCNTCYGTLDHPNFVLKKYLEEPVEPQQESGQVETILEEAQRLVHGDRGTDYGSPLDDFSRTAKIWSAIIGVEITAEQVGLCMVGIKISRECNKHKRDNLTDGAGYFETVNMVVEERVRRNESAV